MGSGNKTALQVRCDACGTAFRLTLKRGRLPAKEIPCPKCKSVLNVQAQWDAQQKSEEQASPARERPNTGNRVTAISAHHPRDLKTRPHETRENKAVTMQKRPEGRAEPAIPDVMTSAPANAESMVPIPSKPTRKRPRMDLVKTAIPQARIISTRKKRRKTGEGETPQTTGFHIQSTPKREVFASVPPPTPAKPEKPAFKPLPKLPPKPAEERSVPLARIKPAVDVREDESEEFFPKFQERHVTPAPVTDFEDLLGDALGDVDDLFNDEAFEMELIGRAPENPTPMHGVGAVESPTVPMTAVDMPTTKKVRALSEQPALPHSDLPSPKLPPLNLPKLPNLPGREGIPTPNILGPAEKTNEVSKDELAKIMAMVEDDGLVNDVTVEESAEALLAQVGELDFAGLDDLDALNGFDEVDAFEGFDGFDELDAFGDTVDVEAPSAINLSKTLDIGIPSPVAQPAPPAAPPKMKVPAPKYRGESEVDASREVSVFDGGIEIAPDYSEHLDRVSEAEVVPEPFVADDYADIPVEERRESAPPKKSKRALVLFMIFGLLLLVIAAGVAVSMLIS